MGNNNRKSLATILETELAPDALLSRPRRLETGFPRLDGLLGGGIAPGLIVLGANPGFGKSTFALQLAMNVSGGGTPVLYFSEEMPAERVAAKALSRQFFETGSRPESRAAAREAFFTADELLNTEPFSMLDNMKKWAGYESTRVRLRRNGSLFIDDAPLSAGQIAEEVRAFREEHERGGQLFVIVDCLQILPRPDARMLSDRQVEEENLKKMVELAHTDQVPVLLISSLTRSGRSGFIQMESFQEAGGVEYSADVLLGLQFCADSGEDREKLDVNARKNEFPRNVEIVVLKQRYGAAGGSVRFKYYAEFDCFEECESGRAAAPAEEEQNAPLSGARQPDIPSDGGGQSAADGAARPQTEQTAPRRNGGAPAYINNTMIANELRRGQRGERVKRRVSRNGEDTEIELLHFDFRDWMEYSAPGARNSKAVTRFRLSGDLSRYDFHVADAVYSLYRNRAARFSLGQVLKALSGDDAQTVTAQKAREITESLERLMAADIEIDCTGEMRGRDKIDPHEERVIKGKFLSLVPVSRNGGRTVRYVFPDGRRGPLPLYDYAELSGQIISFPQALLAVEGENDRKLSDTEENIMVKRLLVARLEAFRDPKGRASGDMNKIRYIDRESEPETGLLLDLGTGGEADPAVWRAKSRRLHETVKKILDYYERIGYITGYTEVKSKNGVDGVDVNENVADPQTLFQ